MKASKAKTRQLTDIFEKLYAKNNRRELISPDPLQFVYKYSEPADMEIAGFLAAALAYGRVQQIEKSLTDLFERMGDRPSEFVRNFNRQKRATLADFKHRFTAGDDISDLLTLLKTVLNRYGDIETFFLRGHDPGEPNIIGALSKFCDSLLAMYAKTHRGRVTPGLGYLLPRPAAGSACKRLNLFLRWMVRNDHVDPGLWKIIDKAKLIVPVDVHMGRLCRILGLYDRKTVSLTAAVEITRSFAQIDPADPVKYDFALSRVGIVDNCTGRLRPECELCQLFAVCFRR
ncbi:MAG: TIGR02757 family protein [Planctomycetota bacterium]